MPKKRSKTETRLEDALTEIGLPDFVHAPQGTPGSPDICYVNVVPPVAVFVDGCYWHGCPTHHKAPRTRTKSWNVKLVRTKIRDRGLGHPCVHCGNPTGMLVEQGWSVIRVWECRINANPLEAAEYVKQEIVRQRSVLGSFGSSSSTLESSTTDLLNSGLSSGILPRSSGSTSTRSTPRPSTGS